MTVYTQTEPLLPASGCPEGAIELWQFVANWSLKEHIYLSNTSSVPVLLQILSVIGIH